MMASMYSAASSTLDKGGKQKDAKLASEKSSASSRATAAASTSPSAAVAASSRALAFHERVAALVDQWYGLESDFTDHAEAIVVITGDDPVRTCTYASLSEADTIASWLLNSFMRRAVVIISPAHVYIITATRKDEAAYFGRLLDNYGTGGGKMRHTPCGHKMPRIHALHREHDFRDFDRAIKNAAKTLAVSHQHRPRAVVVSGGRQNTFFKTAQKVVYSRFRATMIASSAAVAVTPSTVVVSPSNEKVLPTSSASGRALLLRVMACKGNWERAQMSRAARAAVNVLQSTRGVLVAENSRQVAVQYDDNLGLVEKMVSAIDQKIGQKGCAGGGCSYKPSVTDIHRLRLKASDAKVNALWTGATSTAATSLTASGASGAASAMSNLAHHNTPSFGLVLAVGTHYRGNYVSFARTLLVNASPTQRVYMRLLEELRDEVINNCRAGREAQAPYQACLIHLKRVKQEHILPHLTRSVGHAIGAGHKEGTLVLRPGRRDLIRPGQALCVSLGLCCLQDPYDDSRPYSLFLSDTVIVPSTGRNAALAVANAGPTNAWMVDITPSSTTGTTATTAAIGGARKLPVLPPQILGVIFRYLDPISLAQASQVCRLWRDIPWVSLDLRGIINLSHLINRPVESTGFVKLMGAPEEARKRRMQFNSSTPNSIAGPVARLRSLNIELPVRFISAMRAPRHANLRVFRLSMRCNGPIPHHLYDEIAALRYLTQLEELDLGYFKPLGHEIRKVNAHKCVSDLPDLVSDNIGSGSRPCHHALVDVISSDCGLLSLRKLSVNNCSLNDNAVSDVVNAAAAHLPLLTQLDVRGNVLCSFASKALAQLAAQTKNLTRLLCIESTMPLTRQRSNMERSSVVDIVQASRINPNAPINLLGVPTLSGSDWESSPFWNAPESTWWRAGSGARPAVNLGPDAQAYSARRDYLLSYDGGRGGDGGTGSDSGSSVYSS